MSTQSADNSFRDMVPSFPEEAWRQSSRCASHGSCVEVARLPNGQVGVRDGKIGSSSPVLAFGPDLWRAFVAGIASGQFDVG
jgi:hypothetical protein